MGHSGSRRDFVKAAFAATLTGGAILGEAESASVSSPVPEESRYVAAGSTPALHSSHIGFPRVHTGRQLSRISCPLGGIGTGGIGLGGRGNLQDWQIFNRPDIGNVPEYAFPGIWVKPAGSDPFSAVLERRLFPPYDLHQEGLGSANVPGLPRFAEAKFFGSFPISRIEFEDSGCSVHVSLDAFSPFQPLDADFSGLPCAVLTYEVQNPGPKAAEAVIAWSLTNPVGSSDKRTNTPFSANGLAGILMADPSLAADDPLQGTFVLAALPGAGDVIATLPTWRGGSGWRVGPQEFWLRNFARTGNLGTSFELSTQVGTVSMRKSIAPGAKHKFRFLLTWHFPNRTPEGCGWDAPEGKRKALLGNYYCTRFRDAQAVAEYVSSHLDELEKGTREFVEALKESTLPEVVKEAASANLSTLVSNTSFRIADGSFHGFEGCGDHWGLGFGTCTHVWNYEVVTQYLFPSLSRSMRETSFGYATDAEGHMDFRHFLPASHQRWSSAAADGQMGQIVKLYFDWILSGGRCVAVPSMARSEARSRVCMAARRLG